MSKSKYIFLFLVSLFVFSTFTYIHPMLKTVPIGEKEYLLNNKNMNIRNRPPLFKLREDGVYFVHPASTKEAQATFTFDNKEKQLWHFSIQKGSPVGKILFIVKKNDDEINRFIVDTKHDPKIDIDINKNDKITVIADCAGSIAGDWGNLKIYKYEPHYILKLRILAFVWVLFILYLVNKGYIFISISSYFGFMLTVIAEKMNYGALEYASICTYTAIFFLVGFISILLYQELDRFKRYKIATFIVWILKIVIFSIPIIFIQFYLVFNKSVDWNILFAIYQTNSAEAIGFIESFVPSYYTFVFLLFLIFIGYILFHQERKERELIERSMLMIMIIVLIGFISLNIFNARIPNLIDSSYMEYNSQIEHIKSFQKKRKSSKIKFIATKKEKGELHVIVIGESLNKYNMGSYGYFRDTTPKQIEQVKNSNLIVFNNAFSNSGNTMHSLSLALTEANQYNGKNFLDSLSFVDIFNKAGFETIWISTQGTLNDTNTIVAALAHSANRLVDMGETFKSKLGLSTHYDEDVINKLQEYIVSDNNRLIVIHIYGNHYKYQDRYPSKYEKLKETKPFIIGTNKEYILSDYTKYDNSVYYNDYVVSEILRLVKKRGGVSSFIYFSDHSEDILRHRGHTAREDGFNLTMAQIPMTTWVSQDYIKKYPKKYSSLLAHKDVLFSNDMIYDTLIGLANIKTDRYGSKYDLSSQDYELKPQNALTLHGKIHYNTPKNYYYWRKYNTSLLGKNITKKIVINNTTTVGKLNEALRLGYSSFKISLKYLKDNKSLVLDAKNYKAKTGLVDLLSYFKMGDIDNILLEFTNLDNSNVQNMINNIKENAKKLNIQDKIVIILNDSQFKEFFKNSGFKVLLLNSDVIINNAFDIADSKLENRLKYFDKLKREKIKFIIANFKSEFDK